jgi:hypothetical protein
VLRKEVMNLINIVYCWKESGLLRFSGKLTYICTCIMTLIIRSWMKCVIR